MLDCHCHILPSVDDGAKDLEQSIRMLDAARQLNITHIVATPHRKHLPVNTDKLAAAYALLKPHADARGITLQLGCELYAPLLSETGFDALEQFCFADTRYLLLEFHPQFVPDHLVSYLNNILSRNITPIIAHPERYATVQQNPSVLADAVNLGCYLQINGRSISTNPLDKCSSTAKKLLKQYSAAFLSSDAHNETHYIALGKAQQKYQRMWRHLP